MGIFGKKLVLDNKLVVRKTPEGKNRKFTIFLEGSLVRNSTGSVREPLLLLIYIQNLNNQDNLMVIYKYVDDTKLISKVQQEEDIVKTQYVLNQI